MKYNIELLIADIHDELKKIKDLEEEFSIVKEKLEKNEDEISSYDRAAIGYYLHNFYNGCENIFRSIARFFENDIGPQTWHSDMLKRMKLNIPGFRPAVINEELFCLLDDFRGFRHKFRHSYAFELDWEKERLVARKLHYTRNLFHKQVKKFLKNLEKIDKEEKNI